MWQERDLKIKAVDFCANLLQDTEFCYHVIIVVQMQWNCCSTVVSRQVICFLNTKQYRFDQGKKHQIKSCYRTPNKTQSNMAYLTFSVKVLARLWKPLSHTGTVSKNRICVPAFTSDIALSEGTQSTEELLNMHNNWAKSTGKRLCGQTKCSLNIY